MNAKAKVADLMEKSAGSFEFDAFFAAHYARLVRTIARITGDRARAEDLTSEAFWKLWRNPRAQGQSAAGWVYRTAVRMALNDLRSNRRRSHYEGLAEATSSSRTPEEIHTVAEERRQVRAVLTALEERDAELLMLRMSGLSYDQIASALGLNPGSVGTLLSRAQQAFRKEYLKQHGQPENGH